MMTAAPEAAHIFRAIPWTTLTILQSFRSIAIVEDVQWDCK